MSLYTCYVLLKKWGCVFIMCFCTLSRWLVIVWYVKFPKGLRRREEVSHPVFFVLCDVWYCVESRLFFSVLFTYFYGFIYSIQLCVVATWVVGWSWCLKCSFSIICTRMLLIAVRLTFRAVFANADYTKLVLKLYVWKNKAHWNIKKNLKKKKGWSEHVQVVYYRIGFIFWGLL